MSLSSVSAEASVTAPDVNLESVVAISTDVWACFLGAAEEFWPTSGDGIAGPGYVASVTVSGEWNGHVLLELGEHTGVRAARLMLGVDEVTPGEVIDAVGELVNMVGGNLKGLVPAPSQLGLPLVVKGTVEPAPGRDVVFSCTSDFTWAGEPVRVSVWEYAPTGTEGTA